MAEGGDLRVVLLGKTGAGKSSLGNTLLGDDAFMVIGGMSSGTVNKQVVGAERFGTYLQVVDTPGLCDTHRDKEEVLEEVGGSITAVHPGPHIILLVLRCDSRFTKEEYAAYTTLKTLFGDDICHHMIVVFNGIDHLHNTPVQQRLALDEEVRNFSGSLRHVLEDAKFRYYGVNNKASWSSRDQSASALVHMMESLSAKNQGAYFGCHTPDLCDLGPNCEDSRQEEEEEEEEEETEEEEEEEDADDAIDADSEKYTCGIM